YSLGNGMTGILLVLLKAHRIWKNPMYKEKIEEYLFRFPEKPLHIDYSLDTGLSGLGELYIQAYQELRDESYLSKAQWIANTFVMSMNKSDHNAAFWNNDTRGVPTCDLFHGNTGILHFLLRYLRPDGIRHPLEFDPTS